MAQGGRRGGVRAWLVEPYFQIRLGLMVILLNVIFAALIGGVFYYYMYDVYETINVYFKLTKGQSLDTFMKFAKPLSYAGGIVVLFIICTFIVSIRYTHQIYGPLVSIRRYLDEWADGRTPAPLQLRSSDQLNDLAAKLNEINSQTQNTSSPSTSELEKVVEFVESLQRGESAEAPQFGSNPQLKKLVDSIKKLSSQPS